LSRVVALGVDGLDWSYVQAHRAALPTLDRFSREGVLEPLESIFPPDSIPAWTTILTGLPPAEHGIVGTIDYLGKNPTQAADAAPAVLRGRTFWDEASRAGKRVCVVNPFLAYPAWPVNGVMVSGPVFVDAAAPSIFPPDLDGGPLPQLGGIVSFPTPRTLPSFIVETARTAEEQNDFALRLFAQTQPDLLFVTNLTLDRVQHFLWRYCDPSDPTYPGPNEYEDEIENAYTQLDALLGAWTARVAGEDVVLVFSDHGHGRRCTRMVYVDEVLRRAGLLDVGGARAAIKAAALDTAKRAALATAFRLGREEDLFRLGRRLPGRKALKNSSYSVARAARVSTSRLFGRNGFGGVAINRALGAERSAVRAEVVAALSAVAERDGKRVFSWIAPREEVLHGDSAERFPDVLFELEPGYGVDFGIYGPVFGQDRLHRRVSGGHTKVGVFGASRVPPLVPAALTEIYSAVLAALEVRPA
jgi:predicted AlkP superfamily phosphohydrolase/phosphomutase